MSRSLKDKLIIATFALALFAAIVAGLQLIPTKIKTRGREVTMVIKGPPGESFTGRYVADGITNAVSAVTPAKISAEAKEFGYEFLPGDARQEFRVELEVGNVTRTSFVSYKGQSVKGGYRISSSSESVW